MGLRRERACNLVFVFVCFLLRALRSDARNLLQLLEQGLRRGLIIILAAVELTSQVVKARELGRVLTAHYPTAIALNWLI